MTLRRRSSAVFEKYKTLFDGTLGKHPTAKIDIELLLGLSPSVRIYIQFLLKHNKHFNKEGENMIADGIFTRIGEFKWGFSQFHHSQQWPSLMALQFL